MQPITDTDTQQTDQPAPAIEQVDPRNPWRRPEEWD